MARKALIVKSKNEPKYKTRRYNRCQLCGRPRSYYRKFQNMVGCVSGALLPREKYPE